MRASGSGLPTFLMRFRRFTFYGTPSTNHASDFLILEILFKIKAPFLFYLRTV